MVFLLPLSIAGQTGRTVTIKGILQNFSSQVMIEDISDMQYLLPPKAERMVIPKEDGSFQITFKLTSPNYYRLGRNILYLSPGDNLVVRVDYKDPLKADFKGKGDPAIDFTAVDVKGNPVNLASLKGKVIYLDLWATWCGPCLQEMPVFEKLKEKYKDNQEIAFVSLSIDDDTDSWQQNLNKRKADGLQWLISRNKLLDYDVVGIPRTIIIDKAFKVANLNAPVPSAKETEKIIEEMLR